MQSLITQRSPRTLPEHRFTPENDQLNTKLLAIALEELPKPKPLRRSELARLHYKPEPPVVLSEPKKSGVKGFLQVLRRLVRPAIILTVVALGILAIKAYNNWFAEHFWYGVEKTTAYHVMTVEDTQREELPDGRIVDTRYKGKARSVSEFPSIEGDELGDMWYTTKDGNYWVLETLTPTSSVLGWVDP